MVCSISAISVRPLNFMYSRRALVYAFFVAIDLTELTK